MRTTFLLWSVLGLASIAPTHGIEELKFLAGSWLSESDGASTEEHWIPAKGGTMFGVSRTVASDRTVAFEFLRIETRENGIFYVAQPNGRSGTDFRLTELTPSSVRFENPSHDHPKIIRYTLSSNGTLAVEIEGDEKGEHLRQQFLFRRFPNDPP